MSHFIAECYEQLDGKLMFNGSTFESGHVGGVVPSIGDTLIVPLSKKTPDQIITFTVRERVLTADTAGGPALIRLIVTKRADFVFRERIAP